MSVLYRNHIDVIKFTFVNRFFLPTVTVSLYYLPPRDDSYPYSSKFVCLFFPAELSVAPRTTNWILYQRPKHVSLLIGKGFLSLVGLFISALLKVVMLERSHHLSFFFWRSPTSPEY